MSDKSFKRNGSGLDVEKFSKSVIDGHNANPGHTNRVLYEHADKASNEKLTDIGSAAKIARSAISQYDEARNNGYDHQTARDQVAQEMGKRFDERGRDMHHQERQRSQGLGL